MSCTENMQSNSNRKHEDIAVLAGLVSPHAYGDPLEELERLSETAGVKVVGRITQGRQHGHPATYLGKGKLEELVNAVQELKANVVICDDDLSLAQIKNLDEALEVRVVDRTELILDIFALHAKTYDAKLQVELAQLQYQLPRLKRMWEHLDRYRAGVGTRGPGEKQLESDKRIIKTRIRHLADELKEIQKRKRIEVKSRNEKFLTVGLVGYTNAGKSTLMNALTDADAMVAHRLFSTLDTRTRLWQLQGQKVMLSDTVGFIEKLPHHLVASFKSTLEEAVQSDLLLHVTDVAHPNARMHIDTVNRVLEDMGVSGKPILHVFNKIDAVEDRADLANIAARYRDHVSISARHGTNLDELRVKVLAILEGGMVDLHIAVSVTEGKILSWIEDYTHILEKSVQNEEIRYRLLVPPALANWILSQPHVAQIS